MLVNEKTHQFSNCDGGMGIVQLNCEPFRELFQCATPQKSNPYHVLEGTADEEILLGKAKLATDFRLIIGIQDLGDGLRGNLFLDGAVIISHIEGLEIERLHGLCGPQAQSVTRGNTVSPGLGCISDTPYGLTWNPPGRVKVPVSSE